MFDVSDFAPRDQFEAAVGVSGMCLVAAIMLREWFADREIRALARILGVAGYLVVVAFAWRMTETNETLATQLMVKGKQDATSIADQPSFLVAQKVVELSTKKGTTISWTEFSGGRIGPVSVTGGRAGRGRDTVRQRSAVSSGTVDGFDDVPHEQHAVTF